MERRKFVKSGLAAGVGSLAVGACAPAQRPGVTPAGASLMTAGPPLKQSVCKWCFPKMTVEQLAVAGREIGLKSIELLGPADWPTLAKHGLTCAMGSQPAPHTIARGFNRIENHSWLVSGYETRLREAADAGIPSVICFSGNREGMSDAQGLENCAVGLAKVLPTAERLGVNVVMELLNSKVNHPDYMCDHTAWGVELAKKVGSSRFGLLYDIYHMQIMEGDLIRTIKANHQHLFHYHTAGNPGRHEIDETQELFYPAIMRAIKETGFTGYVGQEFLPTRDPLASLAEAVRICNV
ncbi:MAG: TIM barrel protein [Gemmatimonadetes bacterium]|nr:TIM barrel protein [Gemmatimonadota bacterium]